MRDARLARRSLAGCALAWAMVVPPASAEIFACAGDAVRVFADDAVDDAAPLRIITGPMTGINECYGVALDTVHGELWVTTQISVSAFRATDSGNVPPLRSIGGNATGIGFAVAVAVDVEAEEVIVGGTSPGLLATFPRTGSGNIAPTRAIQGGSMMVGTPTAVFIDRVRGELVVSSISPTPGVYSFDRLGSGDVPPLRPPIALTYPAGLFVDARTRELYVVEATYPALFVFNQDGAVVRTLQGPNTQMTSPYGLSVTWDGELLVGNRNPVFDGTDPIRAYVNQGLGNLAPVRQINLGAPSQRHLYGIVSSRAHACGAGNVVSSCLFRDGFQR
jgi:hypothetical protein